MLSNEIHFVLVPGTWARRAQRISDIIHFRKFNEQSIWANPNSKFSAELIRGLAEAKIKATIEDIKWTQRNSFLSRLTSQETISEKISQIRYNDENTPICIIAHSHGGNAALKAWTLDHDAGRQLQLITLATPFLNVRMLRDKLDYLPSLPLLSYAYGLYL